MNHGRKQIQSCSVQCKTRVLADWLFVKGKQRWLVLASAEFREALIQLHPICHNPSWSLLINRFTFTSGLDFKSDSIGSHHFVCSKFKKKLLDWSCYMYLATWWLLTTDIVLDFRSGSGWKNEGKKNIILPNMILCLGWKNANYLL